MTAAGPAGGGDARPAVTGVSSPVGRSERVPSRRRWWSAAYVLAHHLSPSAFNPSAAIHGYHVAFWVGVGLIAAAFLAVLVLVNAGRNDNSTQPAAPAGGDAV
jgi:hypothetical protein